MRDVIAGKQLLSRKHHWRLLTAATGVAVAIGLAWFIQWQATTTVILVRHAEKASLPPNDPDLSDAGKRRAMILSRILADSVAINGIDAIFATPFRRTRQTAKAVADAFDLPVHNYAAEGRTLVKTILDHYHGQTIVVVGHSNTLSGLIAGLGVNEPLAPIDQNEYDNLYIVTVPLYGKSTLSHRHYGVAYQPDSVPGR